MNNDDPSPTRALAIAVRQSRKQASLRPHKTKIAQLLDLQWVLYGICMSEQTEDEIIPACACAWERLENRLARMRMRPEPRPIDVTPLLRRRRQSELVGPTEIP